MNANTLAKGTVFESVGTILFNMVVNPASGKLYVTNTESPNEIRFEGARHSRRLDSFKDTFPKRVFRSSTSPFPRLMFSTSINILTTTLCIPMQAPTTQPSTNKKITASRRRSSRCSQVMARRFMSLLSAPPESASSAEPRSKIPPSKPTLTQRPKARTT